MAIDLVAVLRLKDDMTSGLKKAAGVATVGFAAITAAATVSVNKFVEFDTAIRKTGAIAGANAAELEALSASALDLGASTSKSATEVANAMTELAAGGFAVNDVMSAMPGIIAASEASGESLAVASETVSSALNIWGLEAEKSTHIADVLAMAANVSAAGIQDLGYAFKYAGAPAAALGVSLEETAAAIGIMSNSGIDGGSAGTALRASLLALNNPAKAQAKIMDQLGFSVTDASGNFKSLSTMVGDMQKATEGMAEADKVATLGKLVGTEAVSGFLALMKAGPSEIDAMTDSLINSGGAAGETAKQMMGGIGGALEEASGAIETMMIKVGEALAPTVMQFADFIAAADFSAIIDSAVTLGESLLKVAQYVTENWPQIVETIRTLGTVVLGAVVAVTAFKVIMAGMAIIGVINNLLAAYRAGTLLATAAQMLFNSALWANPIGLIVGAIAVLIGIIVVLALNWDKVTASVKSVWESIGGLSGVIAIVLGPLGFLINAAIDLAKNWDSTKSVWENVWGAIQRSAATSVNAVIGLINSLIGTLNKIPGVSIPLVAKVDWGSFNNAHTATSTVAKGNSGGGRMSHYNGLSNVAYDGYQATLHKGERVLTAKENREYSGGGTSVNITGNQFTIREEADIDRIAMALAKQIEKEAAQIG